MDTFPFVSILEVGIKWGLVVALLVYLAFAVVIVRQVELMVRSFETPGEKWLKRLAWGHLGVVLFVIVLVIIIL